MGFTDWLIHSVIREHDKKTEVTVRAQYAYLAAWVSIVGNIVLAAVKFVLGLMLRSLSMMADAAHTASDVVTSIVVLVGFRAASKPADPGHPFGHGRAENVATLTIAVLLVVVAVSFFSDAIHRLFNPVQVAGSWWAIAIMIVFALFKEWMARFAVHVGHEIESDAVQADAWHHRSDAIASVGVVIALVGARYGVYWLDTVFGIAVAALIGHVAVRMGLSAASTLMGKAVSPSIMNEIVRLARTVTGVRGVHAVTVHQYGPHRIVNVHVETAGELPVVEAHELASRVEQRVSEGLSASTLVHVEPVEVGGQNSRRSQIDEIIARVVKECPQAVNFHALNVYEAKSGGHIDLHVVVDRRLDVASAHELAHRVRELIRQDQKDLEVNIHIEPCDANCAQCSKPPAQRRTTGCQEVVHS